jgi:2-polyprenyl-6-methoxyphenol hydroxylase-like FAD-dependent oxidoreductase
MTSSAAAACVEEPSRSTPIYGNFDVLVIGGGPAGTAAAVAAGRLGADVALIERYNHLGGLSTGGLVSWIDRMSDWDGALVVAGIGAELVERCGPEATLGPDPDLWGSTDPVQAAYWRVRTAALRDTVHWSPTVDPEVLKLVTNDIVRESNVRTLLHCWVVAAIVDDGRVTGVIFESKQGRFALTSPVVIDCTGDGDVFAQAGAAFDDDFDGESAHARLTTSFRFGNVDMRRYLDFRMLCQDEFSAVMKRATEQGISLLAHPTPYDSVALFLTPKMAGYSALDVADLTTVEFVSRDVARAGLEYFRRNVPGFERAWILDTASQVGTRHARRLVGSERITIEHWRADGGYADSIGLCPGMTPSFPTLEIPYGSLVPDRLDGLLAAGRNLSADTRAHAALREIPECWVMGEAAGVAAVQALDAGVDVRSVDIAALQAQLAAQGAIVHRAAGRAVPAAAVDIQAELADSIHHRVVDARRAFD